MAKPIVGHLRARQARDAQGQARARLRLRRRRISLAQERRGHGGRLAAARAFRRFRARCSTSASAPASPKRSAASWSNSSRPIAKTRSPIIRGKRGPSRRDPDAPTPAAHARRPEPLEPGQGPVLGAAAAGAGRRSRLRAHAGRALPPHGAVSAMAHRQEASRLHLRAARSRPAAGADGDFRRAAAEPYDVSSLARSPSSRAIRASDRHPGSGVSCGGRISSGTWRRFTRMRVQVDDRPRIESTSTSSTARSSAASG